MWDREVNVALCKKQSIDYCYGYFVVVALMYSTTRISLGKEWVYLAYRLQRREAKGGIEG